MVRPTPHLRDFYPHPQLKSFKLNQRRNLVQTWGARWMACRRSSPFTRRGMEFERYSATLRLRGLAVSPAFSCWRRRGQDARTRVRPIRLPAKAQYSVGLGWLGDEKNKRTALSTSFSAISCLVGAQRLVSHPVRYSIQASIASCKSQTVILLQRTWGC
ncbi:hypothetical protein K440DRAFT_293956 [Wilcoxina mikolae CBS 423.85]|nr:hypothetical protein K440DRAFT_293956 [Wilcoxina mikolae CBS 423.85]